MPKNLVDPSTNQSVFTFLSEFYTPWEGQTVIEVTVLCIILLVSFTGNIMVIAVVIKNPKLRTVTNFLICNLASTDLLFAAGIPFIAVTRVTQHWIFGDIVCKFVTTVQFVSSICSIVTMVVIAVDRFACVCYVNKRRLTLKEAAGVICIVWCISTVFPVPVAIAQTVQHVYTNGDSFHFCGVKWPSGFAVEIYLGFMALIFFLVPLILITVLYVKIFRVVSASASRTINTMNDRTEKSSRRQMRLVKMFAAIVILFAIMWLPFFLISFLGVYLKQITSTHFTATLILALSNTCQNPILYGYFNPKFKEEFRKICFICKCRPPPNNTSGTGYSSDGTEFNSLGGQSMSRRPCSS